MGFVSGRWGDTGAKTYEGDVVHSGRVATIATAAAALLAAATTGPAVADQPKLLAAKQTPGDYFSKTYKVQMKSQSIDPFTVITLDGKKQPLSKIEDSYLYGKLWTWKLSPGRHVVKRVYKPALLPKTVTYNDKLTDNCTKTGTTTIVYAEPSYTSYVGSNEKVLAEYVQVHTEYQPYPAPNLKYYYDGATFKRVYLPADTVTEKYSIYEFIPTPPGATSNYFKVAADDGERRFTGTLTCTYAGQGTYTAPLDYRFWPSFESSGPPRNTQLTKVSGGKRWTQKRTILVKAQNSNAASRQEARAIKIGMSKADVKRIIGSGGDQEVRAAGGVEVRSYYTTYSDIDLIIGYNGGRVSSIQR